MQRFYYITSRSIFSKRARSKILIFTVLASPEGLVLGGSVRYLCTFFFYYITFRITVRNMFSFASMWCPRQTMTTGKYRASHLKSVIAIISSTVAKIEILRPRYEVKLLILSTGAHFRLKIPKYLSRRIFFRISKK